MEENNSVLRLLKKIFLSKFVFALGAFVILLAFTMMLMDAFSDSREINSESEKQSMLNQLYYVADAVNYYFYDMRNDLELLSYTIYRNEEDAVESIKNFAFKQQVTVRSVTLLDDFTTVIYEENNGIPEAVYGQIIEDGKVSMRNIITPAEMATKIDIYQITGNEYVISYGVKSVPKNGVQKEIIITVSLNDIYGKVISPYQIPLESHPILKDKHGNILLHSNREFIGLNAKTDKIDIYHELRGSGFDKVVNEQLTATSNAQIYDSRHEENGQLVTKKMITAYMPVYFLDDYWIISMTWDYDEVYQKISNVNNRLLFNAILITATIGILLAAVYYLLTNKILLEKETAQLRKYNSALEELHNRETLLTKNTKYRTMGYVTMGIVHELNNLLTPIIGLTELIKDEIGKKDKGIIRREDVEVINESALNSQELVEQVLLMGRKDKTYAAFRDFDLKDALEKSVKVIEASKDTEVDIQLYIDKEPMLVYGNKSQLIQSFINIMINGIHAMKNKGLMRVSLRKIEGVKNWPNSRMTETTCIECRIQDNGCGIDQGLIRQIFLPFYTTKEEGVGTGLGLSVVSDIIKKHKGEIYIDSEKGVGTSVYMYIPLLNIDHMMASQFEDRKNNDHGQVNVCIVNCESDLAKSLESALMGFDVKVYLDQVTYRAMLNSRRIAPDVLIVSDLNEAIDGIQLASATRRVFQDTKIIYLLSDGSKGLNECNSFFVDEYIQLPMDFTEMKEIVKDLL